VLQIAALMKDKAALEVQVRQLVCLSCRLLWPHWRRITKIDTLPKYACKLCGSMAMSIKANASHFWPALTMPGLVKPRTMTTINFSRQPRLWTKSLPLRALVAQVQAKDICTVDTMSISKPLAAVFKDMLLGK